MSVSSPCEICERADVEGACQRCGKLVCERHFEADMGLCVECVAAVGDRPTNIPTGDDMPDGVDTYQF